MHVQVHTHTRPRATSTHTAVTMRVVDIKTILAILHEVDYIAHF